MKRLEFRKLETRKEAPGDSWWVGLDRQALKAESTARQNGMNVSREAVMAHPAVRIRQ